MTKFNPDEIQLESMTRMFEYEKICRELDSCTEMEQLRNAAKCFLKLHMKQQETLKKL